MNQARRMLTLFITTSGEWTLQNILSRKSADGLKKVLQLTLLPATVFATFAGNGGMSSRPQSDKIQQLHLCFRGKLSSGGTYDFVGRRCMQ